MTSKQIVTFFAFTKLAFFYIIIGLITRIVLISLPITDNSFPIEDYFKIFFIGIVNDFCIALIAFVFFEIHLLFLSDSKYRNPWGYLIFTALLGILAYLFFFKTIFDEYGSAAPLVAKIFIGLKTFLFGLFLFFPSLRKGLRYGIYSAIFFLYIFLILFNAFAEFFFWNEFGLRYNFIAVDYLIYTHEVIGNIFESYPMIPMLSVLFLISLLITILFVKKHLKYFENFMSFKAKLFQIVIYAAIFTGAIFLLPFTGKQETSNNVFVNELQANGLYKFYKAFNNQSLDYETFYNKLPEKQAFDLTNKLYRNSFSGLQNTKIIQDSLPEIKKNVVLVTIESLSGSYLQHFGSDKNLTPNLDKLADEGMFFTQLFATGNRTVRGLEALTLCLPPSAGESIVKRENNGGLFSTGFVLRSKGYATQFLYGGFGYFDNMRDFYQNNGYQVIDRSSFSKNEIAFANIWGVCDEDMFNKALKIFDLNAATGKPFFAQIMTVSNHRPFTYPDGRIDIPSDAKSREGGVKYTDYAIGKFVENAKKHSWFSNTVFVFVADHCASSQGKVSLPMDKYHIPAVIYAPNFIQPQKVTKVVSQIDLMPTLFGLLHFSYTSHFYGQDVLKPDYQLRAFASTYQDLGYLKGNILTVLSPNRKVNQYVIPFDSNYEYPMTKIENINQTLAEEAVANYQTSSYLIKNNKLKMQP
ncbi:MAG: LTA synthase family protein [Flavobacteriaceae bacterium]|jgi:phosphoglycerol transferase MdoB-like AlkP superfamily enzyme|nr:LTA synthase family protein [Flavobacteriaceae bacterium]